MKRFALAATVLLVVGVSIALAQRADSPEAAIAEGIFSELKVGEWVSIDTGKERTPISVVKKVEGKTIGEYRDELKRQVEEVQTSRDKIESTYQAKEQEAFSGTVIPVEEWQKAQNERKAELKKLATLPYETKNYHMFWEVSGISSDFVKLSSGKEVICLPESSIRYIRRNIQ